jgi:hypothetical protein
MASKKTASKTPLAKKTAPPKKAAAPAKRVVAKSSPLRGMSVEQYLSTKLTGWQADVARKLVALVRKAAPEATVGIKWAQPVFEMNGPFAYIKPAKAHLTFGFWRGAELADPKALLGSAGERMAHTKLTSPDALDERALADLITQAVKLNREKGDPTKRA